MLEGYQERREISAFSLLTYMRSTTSGSELAACSFEIIKLKLFCSKSFEGLPAWVLCFSCRPANELERRIQEHNLSGLHQRVRIPRKLPTATPANYVVKSKPAKMKRKITSFPRNMIPARYEGLTN